ncbi:BTAD domain-containing putative transcriptional regulator [Nonomuraea typhae]|uniref:BTAD domain-containing putative transcriptional regulator n=1 Tax=Nonomuraea typhae TaxID=2603600 RepID=A0ABW7YSU2_9ACTN
MRFGVLGSVEAWRDGVRTEIGTPRNRAVLARLLLSRGKVIPLDRLIDDLWEGEAPPQALSSLRTFVCQLRRVLDPGLLVTEPGGYALHLPEQDVDSARFERLFRRAGAAGDPASALRLLEEALELWRGPAYVEFAATMWAEGEAARLEELRLSATERRLDALLSLGRHAEAVPELEVQSRAHPTREEGWRLLALGLYRSARQGDALAALREARRYLADELGVDPGPGLRRLEADILAQTAGLELAQYQTFAPLTMTGPGTGAYGAPAQDGTPHAPGPYGAGPHAAGPYGAGPHVAGVHVAGVHVAGAHVAGPHVAGPQVAGAQVAGVHMAGPYGAAAQGGLTAEPVAGAHPVRAAGPYARAIAPIRCLGRDDLLAATGAALAAAESGAGGHLVFEGEPGAGKTELLRAAEAMAHLRGFRVARARTHPLEREHAYGVARQVFEPLLYALPEEERAAVLDGVAAPAASVVWDNGPSASGPAVLHGLYWLAVRLAERGPLLVAVDDLQWSDPESLRFLAYLVRRSDRLPVAVVATRAGGVPAADPGLLEELCALLGRTAIGSPPPEAVAALAAEILGHDPDPADLAACLSHTGGNAFLVTEYLTAGGDCPPTVTRWLGDWLRKAGGPALEVARAVALLGDRAEPAAVAAMAGIGLDDLLDVLPALVGMRVLADTAPLRFAHPVLRQAALDGMPSSVQRIREQALRLLESV